MSHTSDQDDAVAALTEAIDAIERVRALKQYQWGYDGMDELPTVSITGDMTPYVRWPDVLAALEGR